MNSKIHSHDGHQPDSADDHSHNHNSHGSLPQNIGKAFVAGIVLNSIFVFIEFTYGVTTGSVALMADAGHNLSDVLGLILAWVALLLSRRIPTTRFTYGMKRSTILAALLNALLLLVAVGGISWEAIERLREPVQVANGTVMTVASIGIFINALTAFLFASGQKQDLNVKGAFLHMIADALVSLGVVISSGLIMATGWHWLDPAVSLVVAVVIVWSTWGLLRNSVDLSMDAVPKEIEMSKVIEFLKGVSGISDAHHVHIWALSTSEVALTAHLVMPEGPSPEDLLEHLRSSLNEKFKISHVTFQIEKNASPLCESCEM